jgi:hypothetical protein
LWKKISLLLVNNTWLYFEQIQAIYFEQNQYIFILTNFGTKRDLPVPFSLMLYLLRSEQQQQQQKQKTYNLFQEKIFCTKKKIFFSYLKKVLLDNKRKYNLVFPCIWFFERHTPDEIEWTDLT